MPDQKVPKTKRLTKKQKKFVNAVVDPDVPSVSEAARQAGYADEIQGYKNLKIPKIQTALAQFLNELTVQGSTDAKVARRITEGLDAKVVKYFADKGKVKDSKEDIDHPTRHKFIETYLRLKQLVSGGSNEPSQDNRKQLVIIMGGNGKESEEEIMENFI